MAEDRLKLAVFIDFDNIQIGVKDTLGKDFEVSVVLEALKERGEVVTKVAYGDWPRAGDQSRQMTQHAVQMVQRNVTPRGDKNGADINLALDALEMAFTRHHINAFAIVGGDSDFIALVEKLKQYDKRVFVVGGRAFTSGILQRNCTEFIAYEYLLKSTTGDGSRAARSSRRAGAATRGTVDTRPLEEALPNVQRALKILADREVAPQVGLLKSTLLQLDSTFSERDFGAASFLEFMQKMEQARLVNLRRTDRGFLVESGDGERESGKPAAEARGTSEAQEQPPFEGTPPKAASEVSGGPLGTIAEAMSLLKKALTAANLKTPNRPLYLRQIRQSLRSADKSFDERRYGLRSVHDLLHQAQREGWLRLQRDRKGILRIFPLAPALSTPFTDLGPTGGLLVPPPVSITLPEVRIAEAIPAHEEAAPAEAPTLEVAVPDTKPIALPESGGESRKPRKPREAAASGKSPRRRASTHRKPKEPTDSDK